MLTKTAWVSGATIITVFAISANSAARTRERRDSTSERAHVSFQAVAPLTCANGRSASLTTSVNITAGTLAILQTGTTRTASVDVSRQDGCTGSYEYASVSMDDANLSSAGARSASLDESFELVDANSGGSLGILDVSLAFRGKGPLSHHFERSESCWDGWNMLSLSSGVEHPATVKGSVLLDGAPLFTKDTEYAAELSDSEGHWIPTKVEQCECKGTDLTAEERSELPRLPRGVSKSETWGTTTETSFRKDEAITCEDGSTGAITSTLTVTAGSNTVSENRDETVTSQASAEFSRWNTCSNEGRTASGSASLAEGDYEQTGSAAGALESTIPVTDSVSGGSGPVDVALTLAGTGGAGRSCSRRITVEDAAPTGKDRRRKLTIERSTWDSQVATVSGSAVYRGSEYAGNVDRAYLRTNYESRVVFER